MTSPPGVDLRHRRRPGAAAGLLILTIAAGARALGSLSKEVQGGLVCSGVLD